MSQIFKTHTTAIVLFSVSIGFVIYRSVRNGRKNTLKWTDRKDTLQNQKQDNNTIGDSSDSAAYDCFPPLPQEVVNLLRISRLCFLATQSNGEPHLSLMNFTYVQEEEVIVLSTRRNTKKFEQITESPKVAVLIHDFPHNNTQNTNISVADDSGYQGNSWSITLNGTSKILDEGSESCVRLRSVHLANNPDYSQFITAEGSAILCVYIDKARMCDIHDRVSYWNSRTGLSAHAEHSSSIAPNTTKEL